MALNIPLKTVKPNYELKAKVIENGCCALMRKISLTKWKLGQAEVNFMNNGEVDQFVKLYSLNQKLSSRLEDYDPEEIEESKKVNNASYCRTKRLRNRVMAMLKKDECIFLTLTFKNSVLNNTNEETRKKYIKRFLKETCYEYIANIDYGKKNEREHYHAVVIAKDNKIDNALYSYGSINFERVHLRSDESDFENTSKRLSKYVNKLTNHAIKNTVRQNRVIYSRYNKKMENERILKKVFGVDIQFV